MTTLAADIFTTDVALFALEGEWTRLWRLASRATPFQSPAWLLSWWRQFGTGQPLVAVLRGPGGLLGVLPLYILDEPPNRKLLPMGVGLTDYQDALLAPEAPADAAGALLRAALRAASAACVTECDLLDLPPDARLRDAVEACGWRAEWREADPCPVLALPDRAAGLRAVLPANTHRKLRMNRHRAERIGGCSMLLASVENVEPVLGELMRLHEARWDGRGVLGDPRIQAFHRAAAPSLVAAGALRLQVLCLAGEIVAACYALLAGSDRILFYISGYDGAFARQSPGTLLLGQMLEDAIAEGRREAHFLRGGERYKYAWGGVDRMNTACRLVP